MSNPPVNLADAIARLTIANNSLKRHLEESEQRKSVPPPSPWQKATLALPKMPIAPLGVKR